MIWWLTSSCVAGWGGGPRFTNSFMLLCKSNIPNGPLVYHGHTHRDSLKASSLVNPLTGMFLKSVRKPENPEKTHTDTEKTSRGTPQPVCQDPGALPPHEVITYFEI